MASIESMIKSVNQRMNNVAETLGIESNLYQRYTSFVTTALGGSVVHIDQNGKVIVSRGKTAQSKIKAEQIESIREFMNKNSLTEEKKSIIEDVKRAKQVAGDKSKVTEKDIKERAERKLNSTERFQQIHDFIYDNGNEPEAQKAKASLKILRSLPKKEAYAKMIEIAKDAIDLRERLEVEGQPFNDYYVFEEIQTGDDLF